MSKKLWFVLMTVGCCCLGLSYYIRSEVEGGKKKISSAESQVNTGKKLFSLTPYTSPVGDLLSSSADKKISAGKEEIALYEKRAKILLIAGIICIGLGFIGLIVKKKKR